MDLRPFTILSLCAGVGGLDLGLRVAQPNAHTVCFVEIEAYAAAILATRMEQDALDQAPIWTDLRTFDGKPWRGLVDCITAGYPCQPFSVAGKQLGDKDPRHLWPHIARIVSEIQPAMCFFENVAGHLRLGFEQVCDNLHAMGYRVKAGLFTAEEVGAPHRRERLFILAYAPRIGNEREERDLREEEWGSLGELFRFAFGSDKALADSQGFISERHKPCGAGSGQSEATAGSQRAYVADRNRLGCECQQSAVAGQDDPQGRTQCAADTIAGGNDFTAAGLSLHEAGSDEGAGQSGLSVREDPVADATGARSKQDEQRSRNRSEGIEPALGNAHRAGLEGRGCHEIPGADEWPPFPPGPQDGEGWQFFLRLAPDLEPAICRNADGLANRVDRLRLCGNGVVPLAAAYALRTLAAHAGINLGEL
mgnify:CR=1 FL=1